MNNKNHKVSWEDIQIHHVLPHSQGGQTMIENGALVHRDCHPKAKIDVDTFRKWWLNPGLVPKPTQKLDFPPPEGTKAKFTYGKSEHFGEFRNKILFLTGEFKGSEFKSFSAASKAVTKTARNGWKDWYLRLPGERDWVLADDWRNQDKNQYKK